MAAIRAANAPPLTPVCSEIDPIPLDRSPPAPSESASSFRSGRRTAFAIRFAVCRLIGWQLCAFQTVRLERPATASSSARVTARFKRAAAIASESKITMSRFSIDITSPAPTAPWILEVYNQFLSVASIRAKKFVAPQLHAGYPLY